MGILGVIAMPFGFDAECWRQMGYGIEWMDTVALWVASLPGAFGRVTSFGTGPLLLSTAALLVMGLLKTPLRWSGLLLAAVAIVWAARSPVPDVLVANDGRTFAVRGADGRLAFHHTGGDTFAIREWLAADADGRDIHDRGLGQGITCDASGCVGKLADGARVAYALTPDAFEDDCRLAVLVVAARAAPPGCAAMVVDRDLWRTGGALALHRSATGFDIRSTRPSNLDRPWSPAPAPRRPNSTRVTDDALSSAKAPAPPRDATPQHDDIEADQ
jgi:competence protein ComEC